VILGATFSIPWSPCIGPILAIVLTLAAASGTALQGMVLPVAYALGLGVWFLRRRGVLRLARAEAATRGPFPWGRCSRLPGSAQASSSAMP